MQEDVVNQKHAETLDKLIKNEHPPHWPKNVHGLTIDESSILGVDDQGRLY